jgi:hypothetical protein
MRLDRKRIFQELLLRGEPGKIGGNAVAWDGPNQRLNSAAKRLLISLKKDLDLAEGVRSLLEALP